MVSVCPWRGILQSSRYAWPCLYACVLCVRARVCVGGGGAQVHMQACLEENVLQSVHAGKCLCTSLPLYWTVTSTVVPKQH